MAEESWVFERTPKMGGATGEAFTNTLLGAGMEPAAVLAREAIQNSSDAQAGDEKVRVEFRRVTLTGAAKANFVAAMNLKPALTGRQKQLKLPRDTCLETIDDPRHPLTLLYIEDYGTFGLHGKPDKARSHFFRLLLSLGDGAKAREAEGSGGSYGFGKSVYSSNSRIHSIVAYSVFDPSLSGVDGRNHARAMGCGYFNAHEFKGEDYTGRAWFGKSVHKGTAAEPLIDQAAHEFAKRLGFTPRTKGQRGTSLLIVDCGVDCEMLRASIEDWWWPRLLNEELGLDVKLFEDGNPLQPPRPRKRADLRPFIDCYDLAVKRSMPIGAHQKAGSLHKLENTSLGDFGYAVVAEEAAADEGLRELLGTIALIRKPHMVIQYMPIGGTLPLPCVGAFVASSDVDDYLKRSEPATHDQWDPKSARLDELPELARAVVTAINQRLRTGLRRFANEAAPQDPKQDLRLKALEKLLGGVFKSPTSDTTSTGGTASDPITISFVDRPHIVASDAQIATAGSFRVALADDADRDKVKVAVKVNCLVQEDEGVSKEDSIDVMLQSTEVKGKFKNTAALTFELDRDSRPLFMFKSAAYPSDWTTRVEVHVEEV